MKVKASEMEKLFGLSPNGIKLYEKQGIISPERLHNDYRLYGERELMSMGYAIQLRRFGFSMQETSHLMTQEDFEGQEEAFLQRADELEREIDTLIRMRKTLLASANEGRYARGLLGRLEVKNSPAAYFLGLRREEQWLSKDAITQSRAWIEAYSPHTFSAILLDGPYFIEEKAYTAPPQYGLYVPGAVALELGFLPSRLVTYLVPKPCLTTAFITRYESPRYEKEIQMVKDYAQKEGLSLQGGGIITITKCIRDEEGLLCLCLMRVPLLAEEDAFGTIR